MVWQTLLFPLHPGSFSQFFWLLACSPQSSSSARYISIDRMNDGRIKPRQMMRWLQSYVSAGFSVVTLRYVSCHVFFQQQFFLTPFLSLHTAPTFEISASSEVTASCDSLQCGDVIRRCCHCSSDTHFTPFTAAERLTWFTAVPSNGI